MNEERSDFKERPRIQTLSDLIFGLALSIGALTLIGQQPATVQQLMTSVGFYGFSFLILISVWRRYSSIMSVLPTETSILTNLNILLLFLVSIEPYLFNELFALGGEMYSSVSSIYALDLAAMFLILAFFNHALADEDKKLIPKRFIRRYKFGRNLSLLGAAIFIVSIAPLFESIVVVKGIPIRVSLWIVVLLLSLCRPLIERATIGNSKINRK